MRNQVGRLTGHVYFAVADGYIARAEMSLEKPAETRQVRLTRFPGNHLDLAP